MRCSRCSKTCKCRRKCYGELLFGGVEQKRDDTGAHGPWSDTGSVLLEVALIGAVARATRNEMERIRKYVS